MPADGTHFQIAAEIALAPYLAAERREDAIRSAQAPRPGTRWSGMDSAGIAPQTEAQLIAAAIARKAACNSPRAHFCAAVKRLWKIGYAAEAAKLEGIFNRSLADSGKPLDTRAVGSAFLILNPIQGRDAEAARDALAEMLIGGRFGRPALESAA